MKFKLSKEDDAIVYDADLGLAKVSLALLFELKVKHGISAKDLSEMANYLNKYNGKSPLELMDDKVALRALMVVIWLTRRYYDKEKLSLDEANSFAMDEFLIVPDDEDEADPKEQAAEVSAPAAKAAATPNIPTISS